MTEHSLTQEEYEAERADKARLEDIEEEQMQRIESALEALQEVHGYGGLNLPPIETLGERLKRPPRAKTWVVEGWQEVGHRVMLARPPWL
jgi:hypothetical protein